MLIDRIEYKSALLSRFIPLYNHMGAGLYSLTMPCYIRLLKLPCCVIVMVLGFYLGYEHGLSLDSLQHCQYY